MRALLAYSCLAPRRYAAKLPLHGPRCGGATAPGGQPINNQYAICNCDYRNGSGTCTDVGSIAPVGTATLGAGPWGQLDLTGELWEWNLDWYSVYAIPCTDCADTTAAYTRALRGGAFNLDASFLRPPDRYFISASLREYQVGFRCARTP